MNKPCPACDGEEYVAEGGQELPCPLCNQVNEEEHLKRVYGGLVKAINLLEEAAHCIFTLDIKPWEYRKTPETPREIREKVAAFLLQAEERLDIPVDTSFIEFSASAEKRFRGRRDSVGPHGRPGRSKKKGTGFAPKGTITDGG